MTRTTTPSWRCCSQTTAKLIIDDPVPDGLCARLCVYAAGTKQAVISTDTDLLTNDDYFKYAKEVAAAAR